MIKKTLLTFIILFIIFSAQGKTDTISPRSLSYWFDTPTTMSGKAIWYNGCPDLWKGKNKPISAGDTPYNPDASWESQSLPIGNGNLGANILGCIEEERITFNEKSLWRGGPNTAGGADYYWNVNKSSAHLLAEIRQAFTEGNMEKAATLTRQNFNSTVAYESYGEQPFRFGNFTTMGEFYIETDLNTTGISNYKRRLSLDSALATVQFNKNDIYYQRDYFISYPHNVMIIRFKADCPGKQNLVFSYAPTPIATGEITSSGRNGLKYTGHLDNNQMKFAVRIHAINNGGSLSNKDGKLTIKNADEVVFLITADTDYRINFNPDFKNPLTYVGINPEETTLKWMQQALLISYEALFQTHYKDYSSLFKRVSIQLNPSIPTTDNLPINQRLTRYRNGEKDFQLEELYYQFGRYLLISCSRPGNLPANLQGIWHNNVDGPWRIDYHNNINLQMNYWPACQTNLYECMEPLIDFIRMLVKPGEKTAQSYFGARGWTTSVSGNIFGFTTPLASEDMSWNFSPMSGPWLATHIWEYYDYTRDKRFLKDIGYDLIKSSAHFATDYLWHRSDGSYTAAPSTSPEHGPIDKGATFAHAVIREILEDAISASKVLKIDAKERRQWEDILKNLIPYQIGHYGQLMEWSEDIDNPNNQHRHVNHLFGLHPGHTISPITTPILADAAKVVLNHRGDGATGWSMGWKLNQWARLHDGNRAYTLFSNLLKNSTLDNLWDTHPPFQIDGNFGGTAGITEMLMQSHMSFIHLLPALPDQWAAGSIQGLCARGNFEVSIQWKNNTLENATILSKSGAPCSLVYANKKLSFNTVKGKKYEIYFRNNQLFYKEINETKSDL